jgi:hypothetical protein
LYNIKIKGEVLKGLNKILDPIIFFKMATLASNKHDNKPACFKDAANLHITKTR